jgi:hypothetical protein
VILIEYVFYSIIYFLNKSFKAKMLKKTTLKALFFFPKSF